MVSSAFSKMDWALVGLLWCGVISFIIACHFYLRGLQNDINKLIATANKIHKLIKKEPDEPHDHVVETEHRVH